MKKGKYYELKTADMLKRQNPQAQVVQGIRLEGKLSKVSREVDVQLVDPAQYDQIIFECKDHKAKVDIELVEALVTKLEDLGSKKGAIVSNSGFTKGAFNMAAAKGIDLLTLVDTDDQHIRTSVFAPHIVEDSYVESGGISITSIPANGIRSINDVVIKSGDTFMPWPSVLAKHWNKNMKNVPQPGMYTLSLPNAIIIDAVGQEAEVELIEIRYIVAKRYYYRNVRLLNTQGIYNVAEQTYRTNSIMSEPIVVKDFGDPKVWELITEEEANKRNVPVWMTIVSPLPDNPMTKT